MGGWDKTILNLLIDSTILYLTSSHIWILFHNPLLQLLNQLDTPLCRFLLAPEIEEALVWDGCYLSWPTTTGTKDQLDFLWGFGIWQYRYVWKWCVCVCFNMATLRGKTDTKLTKPNSRDMILWLSNETWSLWSCSTQDWNPAFIAFACALRCRSWDWQIKSSRLDPLTYQGSQVSHLVS